VKFSTGVPNCREGRLNPIGSVDRAWMCEVAQAAEQLGYYSLWLNEFLETEPNVRARFDDPPSYYDALGTPLSAGAEPETKGLILSWTATP